MQLVDLTVPLRTGMPVYPGDPAVRLRPAATVAEDGINLLSVALGSQSGTHVDAPFHVDSALPRLDAVPLERFTGPAVLADLRDGSAGRAITPAELAPVRAALQPGSVLLLVTGWSRHWGSAAYADHPWLHPDAAQVVIDAGVRTIGIDAPSVDTTGAHGAATGDATSAAPGDPPGDTRALPPLPTHRVLATAGAVIAENLTNLVDLLEPAGRGCAIEVWLMPIALAGADGAPVRAVAAVRAPTAAPAP